MVFCFQVNKKKVELNQYARVPSGLGKCDLWYLRSESLARHDSIMVLGWIGLGRKNKRDRHSILTVYFTGFTRKANSWPDTFFSFRNSIAYVRESSGRLGIGSAFLSCSSGRYKEIRNERTDGPLGGQSIYSNSTFPIDLSPGLDLFCFLEEGE